MMAFAENQTVNSTVDGRVKEVMVDSRINKAKKLIVFEYNSHIFKNKNNALFKKNS